MAEIVTTLEHNPFKPEIAKNGAIHQCLACFAEHSPHVFPDLTKLVNGGDLRSVAKFLTKLSRDMQIALGAFSIELWGWSRRLLRVTTFELKLLRMTETMMSILLLTASPVNATRMRICGSRSTRVL
ncbi:hypothetical protein LB505_006786 [Fusarium chuoi]|nr:hypothetical protein LB505_006786 [Fusarium chuoi]